MTGESRPTPDLGLVHVFAIGAGAMFSSGFFLLPGLAADATGPSLPLAYLLAAVLVVPTMLSVTELAVAMPRAGGPYHFFRRSMGGAVATIGALGLWVALMLKAAFALVGIDAYLGLLVDVPPGVVGVGLAAVFTVLNVVGARESAKVQVALVAVLFVVLSGFVVAGGVEVLQRSAEEASDQFTPLFTDGALGLLAATAIVFVAFAGLPQVASVAGEIRDPARTIPRGILLALASASAVYVTGTAVLVAMLPADELRGDETPIATAAEVFAIPLAIPLIVGAALAAFASTGNAGVMSASRYPLALARDGLLWGRFARLNRAGVPVLSVVVTGGVVAGVVSVLDVDRIAKLASAFVLVSFGLLNASVVILRRSRLPGIDRRFRAPGSPWLPAVGMITSVVLVVDLGVVPIASVLVLAAIGAVWHRVVRRDDEEVSALRSRLSRRRHPLEVGSLDELDEHGPRSEDRAPEALERLVAARVDEGHGGLEPARSRAVEELASAVGADARAVAGWLWAERHPIFELQHRGEVHVLPLDGTVDDAVVVAWSTDGDLPDHADEDMAVVAVVAGSASAGDRLVRLAALVTTQLGDPAVRDAWPIEPADVASLLAEDASRRQGAEPARDQS